MKKKIKRFVLSCILLILLGILGFVIYLGSILFKYQSMAQDMVSQGGIDAFKSSQTSIIYDADNKEMMNLAGEKDVYYMEFEKIPYIVKRALITSEDRHFYEHSGIDYTAIARAMWELVKNKGEITQGGSTITQQLARNVFLNHEVSYERKIKEMLIAMELEKIYDKDTILEFYINNIYFANGLYGIQAASKGYFSKSVEKLSVSQMVFLCAIPNNPSLYDPYQKYNNTIKRRDRILKQMYEQGDIDEALYEQAIKEKIKLKPKKHSANNYVDTYVRHSATLALMKENGFVFEYEFDSTEAKEDYYKRYYEMYNEWSGKLFTGGYRIYTSIDRQKQKELQKIVDETLSYYTGMTDEGVYEFQGASTCIDNETGRIVAIVGGRTDKNSGYTINRAFQSHRQPGSTIKPLIVYTPALEREYTADSILNDTAIDKGPVNSPNVYEGNISLRYAVEKSKNTTAWKLFEELTPEVGLDYLYNMNFTQIVKDDYILAAAIGGLTYGVSPVEMASAYSALENDGIFRNATCIVRITDSEGKLITDTDKQEKEIYEKAAAREMTDILRGVLTRGTGRNYNISNAICAAKTGTTNDNKDVWFVGYSRYYTTSVWCGYDIPREINDGVGTTCSGKIWAQFMTYLHEGLEMKDFSPVRPEEKPEETTTKAESSKKETSSDELTSSEKITTEKETTNKETSKRETTTKENISKETTSKEITLKETTSGDTTKKETTEKETSADSFTTEDETISEENPTDSEEPTAPGGGNTYTEYWGQ